MKSSLCKLGFAALALAAQATLVACSSDNSSGDPLADKIDNIVVIYAENRGFDNIYGLFPGANGIPGLNATAKGSYIAQTDRDSANTVLSKLPLVPGGVTASGQTPV